MSDQSEKSMDIVFVVVLIKPDSPGVLKPGCFQCDVTKTCVFKVLK